MLANAALDSLTPRFAVEVREAIRAHLDALFHAGEAREPPELTADAPEHVRSEVKPEKGIEGMPLPARPLPTPLPVLLQAPLQEELTATNAVRHNWMAEMGRQQREVHGLYRRTADFRISATDADGAPIRLKGGGTHLGYQTHYVVDGGKRRIILGVLVTPGEVMENQSMLDMLWRVRFRWKP